MSSPLIFEKSIVDALFGGDQQGKLTKKEFTEHMKVGTDIKNRKGVIFFVSAVDYNFSL
jgi:hypothetical protein